MSLLLGQVVHGPPGLFSAPFRAALEQGAPLCNVAVVGLPSGTERWSTRPLSSDGVYYKGRISGVGEAGPEVNARVYTLPDSQTYFVIADADKYFHKIAARYDRRLRGSSVALATIVPGLPLSLCFTYFRGVLDTWEPLPGAYKLTCRTQDLQLRSPFPRRTITAADRPNAPPDSIGRYYQVVYGVHDSAAMEAKGLVAAIQVDSVNDVWHVSLGRLGAVLAVFADGTLVPTSSYAVTYPLTNGLRETCIDFTGTSMTGKTITVDVRGLTDKGDGTGSVMVKPMQVLQHALVNWSYGDWKDGEWFDPATAPIDLPYFYSTDQFLVRKGHVVTLVLGGEKEADIPTGRIESYGTTFHVHPFWEDGRLAIAPLDPHMAELLIARPWVRGRYHDIDSSLALPQNTRQLVSKVSGNWFHSHAGDTYQQKVECEDLAVVDQVTLPVDLLHSAAQA